MEALFPPQTQMLKKNKSMLFNYNLEQKRRGAILISQKLKKKKEWVNWNGLWSEKVSDQI